MGDVISAYLTKILAGELKQLEGKYFDKAQQIGAELFKLSFSPSKQDLLIEPGKRFHLTSYRMAAPEKASNIAMLLRKQLGGKKLVSAEQHGSDRVITLDFGDAKLIAEFFSHGNLVVTDADYNILFTFRKEEWKDRKLAKGEKYKYPSNISEREVKEDYSPLAKEAVEKAGSANAALDEFYAKVKPVNQKLQRLLRRLEAQEKTLEDYRKKAEELKEAGDMVYSNYQMVEEAVSACKNKKAKDLEKMGVKLKERKLVLDLN
jgi:predicted ribosome quality control (RQC) complex YloA/Tae2 family protein